MDSGEEAVLKSVCVSVGTRACSLRTAPGARQGELEGRGVGSGSYPLHARWGMIEEPFHEPNPDSGAVWESGRHRQEPAGGGVQELPAKPTDLMDSSTRPNWNVCKSPGQKLMKTPVFTGWIKPCSEEMMHTKLSSNFFLLANYHGCSSITLWEYLVFLSPPVK